MGPIRKRGHAKSRIRVLTKLLNWLVKIVQQLKKPTCQALKNLIRSMRTFWRLEKVCHKNMIIDELGLDTAGVFEYDIGDVNFESFFFNKKASPTFN